nr:MAG TPA: hypothetical protein [Caudoviricetes sp.]
MTVLSRNVTDSCTICVQKKQERCAILIPSKTEQNADSHAYQRGFLFSYFEIGN